jgi:hypothetical protein
MAESKSDYFSFVINAHSEKIGKFDPLSINRLAAIRNNRQALRTTQNNGALDAVSKGPKR